MILIDTSAWVEYLRQTGSRVHRRVAALIKSGETLATTEIVVMELLAGARDDAHWRRLQRLLFTCQFLPISGMNDYEDAAALYRRCRHAGVTPRSLTDCLIAVVAIRSEAQLLHADRDFDAIARNSALQIAPVTATR